MKALFDMSKIQKLMEQSLAIRSFPIKEVQDVVNNFKLENHAEVKIFNSKITEYLKPYCDSILNRLIKYKMKLKLSEMLFDFYLF